jgi:hypothetical protein
MPQAIAEMIAALVGTALFGGFTLAGLRMWLRYRETKLRLGQGGDTDQLGEAIDGLQDQIMGLRGEVTDLHERLDFAERLLTRGRRESGDTEADQPN